MNSRGGADYHDRLAAEVGVFNRRTVIHDLPDIFHYWSDKYARPKLAAIGFSGSNEVFIDSLRNQCERNPERVVRFVSVGAGNCDLEIKFASELRAAGYSRFVLDCLDLNPTMIENGRSAAAHLNLSDQVQCVQADFNEWQPSHEYDSVIAIQALHHVVNLEGLFAAIKQCLRPGGAFVISDMIGRNGHQRWPEALEIVHEYWRTLPPSYRFNHQLGRYEDLYENWDCSTEGFEGIRSQDILPLLVDNFHFQRFVAYGNVIDPFVERSFGPNFDAAAPWDRAFIDQVHRRDEQEMAAGRIKPTHMFAVVGNDPGVPPIFEEPLSPSFCVRRVDASSVAGPAKPTAVDVYQWHSWPHDAQRELEIACGRLTDAEHHIRELSAESEALKVRIVNLTQEYETRTAWALQLNKEVEGQTGWALQLKKELEERTAWALQLNAELEERKTHATPLRSPNLWTRVWNRFARVSDMLRTLKTR